MKDMSEKRPVSEWKTLGVYVLLLIVVVATVLSAVFVPLDTICLVEEIIFTVLFIILPLAVYILARSKRGRTL